MFSISRKLYYILYVSVLFGGSCANIKNISGGPDDKIPPKILIEKSTPNYSKNFNSKKIIITFDEWITLNNPTQNIIISPPTTFPLKYKLNKKSLVIELNENEVLKDSTTYSINLGEAIKDLTAQNPATNIKYVFSTGNVIDSLQIKGSVRDPRTSKGQDKALVLLHSNLNDSAVSKLKPDYFSWTDKDGNFTLDHIRHGTYKIFTLLDKNQNYIYDQTAESIGFLNENLQLSDTSNNNILLWISQEKLPLTIKDFRTSQGKGVYIFNRSSGDLKLNIKNVSNKFIWNAKDSLVFWYESDTSSIAILQYENKFDTAILKSSLQNQTKLQKEILIPTSRFIKPGQPLRLLSKEAIIYIDSSKIKTLPPSNYTMTSNKDDPRIVEINFNFHNLTENTVVLDSFLTRSINGLYNSADTIKLNLISESSLSKIKVTLENLTKSSQYIFQILDKEKVLAERIFVAGNENEIINFKSVDPGKYNARLILDSNNNQEWDPVNYINKTYPEKIWNWPLEELRPDWEIEVTFNIK